MKTIERKKDLVAHKTKLSQSLNKQIAYYLLYIYTCLQSNSTSISAYLIVVQSMHQIS